MKVKNIKLDITFAHDHRPPSLLDSMRAPFLRQHPLADCCTPPTPPGIVEEVAASHERRNRLLDLFKIVGETLTKSVDEYLKNTESGSDSEAAEEDKVAPPEVLITALAASAHEANRAYCRALGDTSQVSWADAPAWQKDSCRDGVRGILAGNTPEQSHANWVLYKLKEGWTYGPVKDPEKKEHPCLLPYDKLPPEQKVKDTIFHDVVRSSATAAGWPIPSSPPG